MNRLFNFSSIHNFRDFGNYTTEDGRHVAARRLFRSAHLNNLSNADLSEIEDLDIGLVVDLRYRPERDRQPNRLPRTKTPNVIEFPDGAATADAQLAPHEMFIQKNLREADDSRRYMISSYAARPGDPLFQKIFSDTLKHMASTGDPLLIHCAAGKDRTGTLAAVILGGLGVDSATIMDDFMLTMQAVDVDSFLKPAAKMMGDKFGREYEPEALRPMFGVEEEYLLAALESMGDIPAYITGTLGLTKAELSDLRRLYLST